MSGLARLARGGGVRGGGTDREESRDARRPPGRGGRRPRRARGRRRRARRRGRGGAPRPSRADNPDVAEARRRGLPVLPPLGAPGRAHGRAAAAWPSPAPTASRPPARCCCAPSATRRRASGRRSRAAAGPARVWGDGPWFVAEADESDRSLLNLRPEAAILLNVDHDHHATFASLAEVEEVFRAFVAALPRRRDAGGGARRPRARLRRGRPVRVRLVGDVPGAFARVERTPGAGLRRCCCPAGSASRCRSRLAGAHNAANAACALALAEWCGVPLAPGGRPAGGVHRRRPADGDPRAARRGGGGRRLRPPPGRDPGHAAGRPRARARAGGGGVPAPPARRAPARSAPSWPRPSAPRTSRS